MEVIIKIANKYYAGNKEGGKAIDVSSGFGAYNNKPYSSLPYFTKNIDEAKRLGSQPDLVREFEKIIRALRLKHIDVAFDKIEIINVEEDVKWVRKKFKNE